MGIQVLDDIEEGVVALFEVGRTHPLYDENLPIWEKCRDADAGEKAIKDKGTTYLPILSGQSISEYEKYKERAQFYGVTQRTRQSYMGLAFRKPPMRKFYINDEVNQSFTEYMDEELKAVTQDSKSFENFIHEVTEEVIITNRAGILMDYPKIEGSIQEDLTLAEYKRRKIKPMLSLYRAESIINWHTEIFDGQVLPVMFVLYEPREQFAINTLELVQQDAYRILYLENWDDPDNRRYKSITVAYNSSGRMIAEEVDYPKVNGEYLRTIPFYIATDSGIEYRKILHPMMEDLVNVNIGHYRNSADLENELHFVGAKTIYFAGWDRNAYGDPHIGGALAGPKNSQPHLIEPSSDSSIREEMILKEQRLAVLGSERISMKGKYIASAETARITQTSEASVLGNMVNNLSNIFTKILQKWINWAEPVVKLDGGFQGEMSCLVTVNSDFTDDHVTGADLLNYIEAYQTGGVSWDTIYYNLHKREVFPPEWDRDKELKALKETQERIMQHANMEIVAGRKGNPFFERYREELEEQVYADGSQDGDSDSGSDDNNPANIRSGRGVDQLVPIRGTKARVRRS